MQAPPRVRDPRVDDGQPVAVFNQIPVCVRVFDPVDPWRDITCKHGSELPAPSRNTHRIGAGQGSRECEPPTAPLWHRATFGRRYRVPYGRRD